VYRDGDILIYVIIQLTKPRNLDDTSASKQLRVTYCRIYAIPMVKDGCLFAVVCLAIPLS